MFASLSGSQLKQAFVLTGSFADRYPGVGPEGLPQESRSRCPEPRQETPWSWARHTVYHTQGPVQDRRIYPKSRHPQKRSRNNQEDWMASPSIPKGIQGGSSKANNWGNI